MKTLLIYPPAHNMITTNLPGILEDKAGGVYPPLGLLYVAAGIEKTGKHDVAVLDCQLDKLTIKQITDHVIKENPDVVGIQVLTFTLIDACQIAKSIKALNPEIHITMGGPHVNIYPHETIKFDFVDTILLGEAEFNFTTLLDAVGGAIDFSSVPSLIYKQHGEIKTTPVSDFIRDLDAIPHPARHLIPFKRYFSPLSKGRYTTTFMTSRGCPGRCIFCDRPHLGKTFRARTAANVVEEMKICLEMGIENFIFYDDTFTINRRRVVDICRHIVNCGLKINWDIRARINTVDPELLKLLKKAGCQRIHYGVEAGTPRVLNALRKDFTIDQVENVFKWTRESGIESLAYFMIGNPGEKEEDVKKSFELMFKLDPDYLHLGLMTPFPATELYRVGIKTGLLPGDPWRKFAENPRQDFVPPIWEEFMDRPTQMRLLKKGYRDFYMRPSFIWREIRKTGSFHEFKNKFITGLELFKLKN